MMILTHGATDCNGRATQRLYAEKHPVRRTPAHTMPFHSGTCSNELQIPFFFEASVLFTDEVSLSRGGIFNTHNSHSWAAVNPHVTRTRAAQDRFLVNVWADILGDHLIGPYILPGHLTGPRYLIFLEQVLPKLLDRAHVTAATRTSMWFQQDGAPAHSVFLFGITWMQYVVNDGLAVEVQCIDFSDRQTFPVWIISSGANEIVGVRNTRKQRRGTCSTHQCSSRGNTKHSENVIESSTLHEAKM
ncbi:uncharacterized protein TNCV_2176391 [Trichonephila clavipes]|nr:uncharacterized protein TNCV_2176391 [Trichonephila clavipes]